MSPNVRHFLIAGLGFGDEGKGSLTDFLVRRFQASLVVRYNGGPQAAHNVVAPVGHGTTGVHHCFAQFGSGTLAGAETYLSEFMAVDPLALMAEARVLADKGLKPFELLTVDEECIIVTPFHQLTNQLREQLRGQERHGSCGMGVGEAILDLERGNPGIRLRDLFNPGIVAKLQALQDFKVVEAERLIAASQPSKVEATILADLQNPGLLRLFLERLVAFLESIQVGNRNDLIAKLKLSCSVFEGAQGVLLDREAGFFPYVTPSDTTFSNAIELLKEVSDEQIRIGVLRGYLTRHGLGPMPSEVDPVIHSTLKDEHNQDGPWQGSLRVGWFDSVLGRYATRNCPIDALAITNLDRLPGESQICTSYEASVETTDLPDRSGKDLTEFLSTARPHFEPIQPGEIVARLGQELNTKVILTSKGPGPEHKTWIG